MDTNLNQKSILALNVSVCHPSPDLLPYPTYTTVISRQNVRNTSVLLLSARPRVKNGAFAQQSYSTHVFTTCCGVTRGPRELLMQSYLYHYARSAIIILCSIGEWTHPRVDIVSKSKLPKLWFKDLARLSNSIQWLMRGFIRVIVPHAFIQRKPSFT
ncbi:hypothetical protein BDR04DRAFT_578239 [Suillus decipiens]|nr:hypothetical protein BDR04DRAFT_578239 [Suillus decipiens]